MSDLDEHIKVVKAEIRYSQSEREAYGVTVEESARHDQRIVDLSAQLTQLLALKCKSAPGGEE